MMRRAIGDSIGEVDNVIIYIATTTGYWLWERNESYTAYIERLYNHIDKNKKMYHYWIL